MKNFILILIVFSFFQSDAFSFGRKRAKPKTFEVTGQESVYLPHVASTIFEFMKKNEITGLSLALTVQGRLVYTKGYRYSTTPEKMIRPESVFLWASLTKPITWTYTLMKMDQSQGHFHGQTRMTDELGPYYTNYTDTRMNDITIDHLLFHQAGFDRDVSGDPINEIFSTREQRLKSVLSRLLDFSPGEKYVYSNFGYQVLSKIHELRGKKSYFSLLQTEIFNKLTMKRTFKTTSSKKSPLEVDYEKNPHIYEISHMDGSGDLKGSVLDYAKYLASAELEDHNPLFQNKNSHYESQAIPTEHTGRFVGTGSFMLRDLGIGLPSSITLFWNQNIQNEEYTQLKNNLKTALAHDSLRVQALRRVPRDLFPCYGTPSYFSNEHCTRGRAYTPSSRGFSRVAPVVRVRQRGY